MHYVKIVNSVPVKITATGGATYNLIAEAAEVRTQKALRLSGDRTVATSHGLQVSSEPNVFIKMRIVQLMCTSVSHESRQNSHTLAEWCLNAWNSGLLSQGAALFSKPKSALVVRKAPATPGQPPERGPQWAHASSLPISPPPRLLLPRPVTRHLPWGMTGSSHPPQMCQGSLRRDRPVPRATAHEILSVSQFPGRS